LLAPTVIPSVPPDRNLLSSLFLIPFSPNSPNSHSILTSSCSSVDHDDIVKIINRNGALRDLESHPKSGNLTSNVPEESKSKNYNKNKSASDFNSWESSVWPEIKRKILCTLEAAQTATTHREKSFEFLGYDILVDEEGVPWILEVKILNDLK
jgi:hypothetical protein